jgi:hypothetical protein
LANKYILYIKFLVERSNRIQALQPTALVLSIFASSVFNRPLLVLYRIDKQKEIQAKILADSTPAIVRRRQAVKGGLVSKVVGDMWKNESKKNYIYLFILF